MGRIILELILPLIFPTVVYVLWVKYKLKQDPNADIRVEKPWFWLISSGCVLMVIVMLTLGLTQGEDPTGKYEPPVFKDGKIVPGHMVPAENSKPQ